MCAQKKKVEVVIANCRRPVAEKYGEVPSEMNRIPCTSLYLVEVPFRRVHRNSKISLGLRSPFAHYRKTKTRVLLLSDKEASKLP
jgi:hypothetical protein